MRRTCAPSLQKLAICSSLARCENPHAKVCGQSGQVINFAQIILSNLRKQDGSKHKSQSPSVSIQFEKYLPIECPRIAPNTRRAKGMCMRFQYASLKSKAPILQLLNPCPICGAETTLAEIEPHPLHANFEIHGYLCDRCGPIKSLVVLRGPPLQMI